MNKPQFIGIVGVMAILLGVAFWWITSEIKDRNNPLNKYDAFVYSDSHTLYWFEFTSRRGKLDGKLHKKSIVEEIGKEPYMREKDYPLIGKATEKGYEFKEKINGKMTTFDAWFSGGTLFVQQHGTEEKKVYKAVNKEALKKYQKGLRQELETAIYHSEEKEKTRIRNFFTELRSVYGYLYSNENTPYQLFIKIDEALLQGEVGGTLFVITKTGDKINPYEETKYVLNGITDGQMVEFYTTMDGRQTKLKGHFYKEAAGFDLTFWMSKQMLPFHAVTEAEFKRVFGNSFK